MPIIDDSAIANVLTRGVENIYPDYQAAECALKSGKKLRVYLGVDPTGSTLHMGHAIPLRKLAELQKLGHEAILLIGDFTAMIGDPTDKSAARQRLTRREVLANCRQYKTQASKFLSFTGKNPAKLLFNSAWLASMTFNDVVELAAHFTVQQMSERDMFERRMKEGKPVYLHEFLYPLMQGYDSVAMDVDMEIGGNDQTFNMLAGRTMLRETKKKEKLVLTTKLVTDPTGAKMGKTTGNMVALSDTPEEMYGKVMSWTDAMIVPGFEICTNVPMDQVMRIAAAIKAGENPVQYKHELAHQIVSVLVSDKAANAAAEHFVDIHKKRELPSDMPSLTHKRGMTVADALAASKLVSSKSDARRQVEQGGVKMDGKPVSDPNVLVKKGAVLQKGKRHFVKLV